MGSLRSLTIKGVSDCCCLLSGISGTKLVSPSATTKLVATLFKLNNVLPYIYAVETKHSYSAITIFPEYSLYGYIRV